MADGNTDSVRGRDELMRRMTERYGKRGRRFGVRVGTADTNPTRQPPGGKRISGRSAAENRKILHIQAAHGREFARLRPEDAARLVPVWQRAINRFLGGDDGAIEAGALSVGLLIIEVFKQRLKTGVGMVPLVTYYEKLKEWRWGSRQPILVNSGQLMRSFVAEFVRRR